MTRSAKHTFATSAHREPMDKISAQEAFLTACEYSLLALIEEHNDPMSPTSIAQVIGARRVLDILKTIGEPIAAPTKAKPSGLNYSTK